MSRPGARRLWCIPSTIADGWLGRASSWAAWAAAWLLLTASAIAHPAAVAVAVVRHIAPRELLLTRAGQRVRLLARPWKLLVGRQGLATARGYTGE